MNFDNKSKSETFFFFFLGGGGGGGGGVWLRAPSFFAPNFY